MEVTAAHSVTATARRAQIVAATIETIAELGYPRSTFARIAERAGLSSTRLISYHFANKDELIRATCCAVFVEIEHFMAERMAGTASAADTLRAYLESNIEFIATHHTQMVALFEIMTKAAELFPYDEQRPLDALGEILCTGQRNGEFREFDPVVMAIAIRRAIEAAPAATADPRLDIAGYTRELVTLFDLATRKQP